MIARVIAGIGKAKTLPLITLMKLIPEWSRAETYANQGMTWDAMGYQGGGGAKKSGPFSGPL